MNEDGSRVLVALHPAEGNIGTLIPEKNVVRKTEEGAQDHDQEKHADETVAAG